MKVNFRRSHPSLNNVLYNSAYAMGPSIRPRRPKTHFCSVPPHLDPVMYRISTRSHLRLLVINGFALSPSDGIGQYNCDW